MLSHEGAGFVEIFALHAKDGKDCKIEERDLGFALSVEDVDSVIEA